LRLAAAILAGLCGLVLAACGDAVQQQPISHSLLESLVVAPTPVYWLGASFEGMAVTEVVHDPSGAFSVSYGDCLRGGQGVCVPPLQLVSSPDNSFLPGGATPIEKRTIRGVQALLAQSGKAIVLPTGPVVVDVYANTAPLAAAAAENMVAINQIGAPQAQLPARLPDTGFAETPLPSQTPSPLRPLR
jgi:hypothetical protein